MSRAKYAADAVLALAAGLVQAANMLDGPTP